MSYHQKDLIVEKMKELYHRLGDKFEFDYRVVIEKKYRVDFLAYHRIVNHHH